MYDTYVIENNDTIESISSKFGISPEIIYQLNGFVLDLVPGSMLVVPRKKSDYFDYYKVTKGDTLYKIAREFNTTVDEIKRLNNLSNNNLSIGQTLIVKEV